MSDAVVENIKMKVVANQLPEDSEKIHSMAESPLHHVDLASLAKQGLQEGGVHFCEKPLMGLLTLRCHPSAKQKTAIKSLLGVALPMEPLTSATKGDVTVRWISPDEWLITLSGDKAFDLESRFQDKLEGHYSLVNISGGTTVFELSGKDAMNVLKKSTTIDFHSKVFPTDKVVSTLFAKSSAIIRRLDEQRFELVVRRSFSDYIWLWIQDASKEYGLVVDA